MNIIFDFDGTIADSLPAFIAVFNKTVRGGDNPLSSEEIETLRGMSSRKALRNLGVRWWQVPKLLLQGIPDFHALVPTLKPCEGMSETLEKLFVRGDKLFIVTSNTRDIVDQFLIQHDLDGYFSDIATGARLFRKSKHIRKLMKANNLRRKDTLYVGDETRDIQAARLAGVKIVSVGWGFNTKLVLKKRRPNFLLDKPKELLGIKI